VLRKQLAVLLKRDWFFVRHKIGRAFAPMLSLLILTSVLVSGCGKAVDKPDKKDGKIKLVYWAAPNPQEIQLATKLVAEWNKTHPNIEVEMQPLPVNRSTEEVLMAAIAAKTTPDVCSNIWPGSVPEYARAGAILKLNTFPDFDSLVSARVGMAYMDQFKSVDGNYYQIPWKANPLMMIYNKSLFKAAGISKPPLTYSEFLADAAKLTFSSRKDGVVDHWMGYRDIRPVWWQRFFDFYALYKAASNGKAFTKNGDVVADTEAVREVLSFFGKCFSKGYFPRTVFSYDPFLQGVVATEFVGPWTISYIRSNYGNKLDFGIAPIPVPDDHIGPVDTYGDHKCISIFSTTKYPKESWEFVKFLLSQTADLELMKIASQLPVRRDLLSSKEFASFFDKNHDMRIFAEEAPYAHEVDQTPDQKEIFDAISQIFEKCSVYNKENSAKATKELVKNIRVLLAWDQ
jgi:multiple sugar transport system substrate-binding protein